jgi:DNA-binding response OmpR family regulator/curved DNA-binding protein CbpA
MPHRILVVDDEEAVRSLIRDYLESRGMEVLEAHDVNQALTIIRDKQPHLTLIDFLLPKKNGFALAEAVRKDPSTAHMPLVMMSGVFKNPKTAVEAREKYQVVDFLSKPIDMERLYSLIHRALREAPSEDEPPRIDSAPSVLKTKPGALTPSNGEVSSGAMELELASSASMQKPSTPAPRGLSYGTKPGNLRGTSGLPAPTPPPDVKARAVSRAGSLVRRPFPPMMAEGELEAFPVAQLISILRFEKLTGMLDLTNEGTHRRVYVLRGQPIFMQSNADGENVGALLLRRGRITEPDFDRCVQYMDSKKRTLQQALLELRLATDHDLSTAYKLLAGQLLPSAIGMASGQFKWRETDAFVGRVPEGNFEPLSVLFDGIKRHVHPPQILKFFKGKEDIPLKKTSEFEPLLPFFRRAFSANNIASMITGKATYREITRARSNDAASVVPQLFALLTSGMARLPDVDEDMMVEVEVNHAAAAVAGLSIDNALEVGDETGQVVPEGVELDDGNYNPDEERARAKIVKGYAVYMTKDFFDIFGVRPDDPISIDTLKDAYFRLAKQWHGDSFAGLRLGDAQKKLDEMFSRITEAYETLNDPQKLAEYKVYLDRQSKGLPTDVQQILRAEQIFDDGIAKMRRRDYAGAAGLFREAINLNAGEAIFWAHLGWITFVLDQSSTGALNEAVQHLKKAISMQENLPIAYQFLGQISQARGQTEEAKRWYSKCLEWEPGNIEASRALRMIGQRGGGGPSGGGGGDRGPSKSTGLLSRFLSKK